MNLQEKLIQAAKYATVCSEPDGFNFSLSVRADGVQITAIRETLDTVEKEERTIPWSLINANERGELVAAISVMDDKLNAGRG